MEQEQYTNINEETQRFLEVVRGSYAYNRFERAKEMMKDHAAKKAVIDEFRERSYLLSNSSEPLDHMDELEELFVTRRHIRMDPMIDEYLTAEHEYCRMIRQICAELMSLSDVEIEAFEDRIRVM